MKRRSWRDYLIRRLTRVRSKGALREREAGGIILEASIVLPMFLMLVMAIVIFIQATAAQIAVQSSSVQVAKQTAAHWHPVALAGDALIASAGTAAPSNTAASAVSSALPGWKEIAADAAEWLPEPVGSLSAAALRGDGAAIADYAMSQAGRAAFQSILQAYADSSALQTDRLTLNDTVLPSLNGGDAVYVEMEAEYPFPLRVPFTGEVLKLREKAVERAWVPDAAPASYRADAAADKIPIQIVSLEPEPLRPGRKATVVARTNPNTILTLSVLYKSGYSIAKNVGSAASDANGYVSWTWLVSGNTTPGIWRLEVKAGDGSSAGRSFSVEKASP